MTDRPDEFKASLTVSLLTDCAILIATLLLFAPFKSGWGFVVFLLVYLHMMGTLLLSIVMYDEKKGWLKNTTRLILWEAFLPSLSRHTRLN